MKHPISTRSRRLFRAIRKLDKKRRREAAEVRRLGVWRARFKDQMELGAMCYAQCTEFEGTPATAFERWHQEQMQKPEYRAAYEKERARLRADRSRETREGTALWIALKSP